MGSRGSRQGQAQVLSATKLTIALRRKTDALRWCSVPLRPLLPLIKGSRWQRRSHAGKWLLAQLTSGLQHQLPGLSTVVVDHAIEDRVLDHGLDVADELA